LGSYSGTGNRKGRQHARLPYATAPPLYSTTLNEKATVSSLAFSPNGRELACAIRYEAGRVPSNRILIAELASMKKRAELVGHGDATINCLAYSADGRLLASGAADATVLIWPNERRGAAVLPEKSDDPARSASSTVKP
jgi:WD40 repeat protein